MATMRVALLTSLLMVFLPASAQAAFFTQPAGSPYPTASGSSVGVAAGDFNLDTKPDLALVNSTSPGKVTILLGDGAGGFTPAVGSPYTVGNAPMSIAVADLNNDGRPDFVTSNFVGA